MNTHLNRAAVVPLRDELRPECEAMTKYAFESGLAAFASVLLWGRDINMPVNVDKVTPGIALSWAEANRLKGQIEAYIQGIGMKKGRYTIPDFKDDRGSKRRIEYQVTSVERKTIHVELISMT